MGHSGQLVQLNWFINTGTKHTKLGLAVSVVWAALTFGPGSLRAPCVEVKTNALKKKEEDRRKKYVLKWPAMLATTTRPGNKSCFSVSLAKCQNNFCESAGC